MGYRKLKTRRLRYSQEGRTNSTLQLSLDGLKNCQVIVDLEVIAICEVELGCGHTVSVKTFRYDI